jgi:subtilisin
MNTVVGENPNDFGPNGSGHGTHVAGIIAGRGKPPSGLRGLAPSATLRSYRVFGKNAEGASNYDIIKGIDQAVTDDCDLINLSLGGGPPDDAMSAAIEEARSRGTLVIVAAGNGNRSPVSFPASDPSAIAISATGRKRTFPKDSTENGDIARPYGKDRNNFLAAFSNIGPELDLTGPGVGVLSTVPGGYASMSGTSMACPAVTGFAAKMLSTAACVDILNMERDQARSDAMAQALFQAAKSLGFGPRYEGKGLPL